MTIQCFPMKIEFLFNPIVCCMPLQIIKITTTVLPYLRDILDYFKEQSSSVKSILLTTFKVTTTLLFVTDVIHQSCYKLFKLYFLQPIIFKAVTLFNVFGTTSTEVAICVLNFSLSVIRTLQVQLGSNYVKEMLGVFLDASTRYKKVQN